MKRNNVWLWNNLPSCICHIQNTFISGILIFVPAKLLLVLCQIMFRLPQTVVIILFYPQFLHTICVLCKLIWLWMQATAEQLPGRPYILFIVFGMLVAVLARFFSLWLCAMVKERAVLYYSWHEGIFISNIVLSVCACLWW